MNLKPEEISSVIKEQIKDMLPSWSGRCGNRHSGGGRHCTYPWTGKCDAGRIVRISGEVYGMVLNLEEDNVGAVLLGSQHNINEGDTVKTTGRVVEVPVGNALLGRVVNALGQPIDGKGPITTDKYRPVERVASGVISRKGVDTPLQTGIKAIDSMVPIGRARGN